VTNNERGEINEYWEMTNMIEIRQRAAGNMEYDGQDEDLYGFSKMLTFPNCS